MTRAAWGGAVFGVLAGAATWAATIEITVAEATRLFEVAGSDKGELDALMDSAAYQGTLDS